MQLLNKLADIFHTMPLLVTMVSLFLVIAILIWLTKRTLLFVISKVSSFAFATILLEASKRPLSLLLIAISLFTTEVILRQQEMIDDSFKSNVVLISKVIFILALILFIDKMLKQTIIHYEAQSPLLKTSGNLVKSALRIIIFVIGILVLIGTFGVSITPILASLGIGSLAVALALQPTLENFFSGMQILADKPIRVGDYVELESGEQGFVEKIGWRSVWIKMLPNNIIIIPNSLLAKSKIINYYYPEKQLSVPVDCSVHYDSDLERVEQVALEVAREILISHKWGIDDYDTFVIFHTFDNSSINFTVMLRAQEYFNRFFIKSAYIKALHKRFKLEGIVIPYPISAVNFSQEKSNEVIKELIKNNNT